MAKQIVYGEQSRQAILRGVNQLAGYEPTRTVAEIEAEMEAQVAREMASMAPDIVRASTLKKQLVERSRKQPESVAMTIRGWLQENKR